MSGEGYRVLLRTRARSTQLRAKRFTWDQIADVLALDHNVSPLRLYRLAHGRTAAEVVSLVSDLGPAGTASVREARLYDFEAWPAGGRKPPVRIVQTVAAFEKRLYWISPSMLDSKAVMSLVRLRQPREAVAAARRTLAGLDPRFKADRGLALAQYATALTLAREIPEAVARLTEAADIAAQHTSARLAHQITHARAGLQPWAASAHVRALDTTLRAHGLPIT
ncbi:hypothetical protein F5972_18685 [Microbispora cellulosiformans]|uniref:Uncharacterized protein n=1 Tax=Microbispora cellulosiformans TaxID=2614688 RepID=A0A5J5K262_9ACTN|nr:hypothetical protein [Microbispora cellulosiformans]KAA9377641.1 hypothetical protein F5972_18685 [Microbispora cellulosiformans]